MQKTYYYWRKAMNKLNAIIRDYCVIILLIMLVLAFTQVIRRYFFNSPWSWSDEIVLLILAWFSYPAICLNIWTDNHFHISTVYNKFPPPVRLAADIMRHILVGIFTFLLAYYGMILFRQYLGKPYPASGLSQALRFFPVVFGGGISFIYCISNILALVMPSDEELEVLFGNHHQRRNSE